VRAGRTVLVESWSANRTTRDPANVGFSARWRETTAGPGTPPKLRGLPGRSVDRLRSAGIKFLNTLIHIHRCMVSKTISLEQSAYEKLRAAKRTNESFSDVVTRILAPNRPSLAALAGFLTPSEAKEVRATIRKVRQQDEAMESARLARWREPHGRRRRQ
jgi:predicted CopG family antitoxin